MKRDRVTTGSDPSNGVRVIMKPNIIFSTFFVCLLATFGFGIAGDDVEDAIEVMNHPVELTDMAKQAGAHWMIRGVEVDGLGLADLRLEQVEVFAADAKIIINDGIGETIQDPPGARFLRGEIDGLPGSIVALMQAEDGNLSGLMTDGSAVWEIKRPSTDSPLETSAIDADTGGLDKPFVCGQEKLPEVPGAFEHLPLSGLPDIEALPADQLYQATISIETDYELYERFGSTSATTNYIGNLFNYISGIYEVELQTRLGLGNVYLWTTSADPWVETGSTTCRLYEFGRYWRNNRASVPRTLAHFLSGRALGGGVAWLDQLCQPARSTTQSTGCATVGSDLVYGGFGVSANLNGTIGTPGAPAWDAVVVAHELGHNFSSPHTHCYRNIGGSSNPVDACWNQESGAGCWAGATGLPGVNALSGGTASGRNGTIMSYCHQQSGGIANIAGTLGLGHLFGVNAARVPNMMASSVAAVASANPACIPVVNISTNFTLSVNSSGTSGVAISAEPSTYAGTTNYTKTGIASGTSIVLTAPSTAGSANFSSWSGCNSTSGTSCTVSMTANKTVTANFNNPPPGYALTVNSSGASNVPISANPSTYGGTTNYTKSGIASGTSILLTVPSTAGSATFNSWSGCNSTSGTNCTVSMTVNKTVTANFSSCPGQTALARQPDRSRMLDLLYQVRDEVLAASPDGQWLTEVYYKHAREVSARLAAEPRLGLRALELVRMLRPDFEQAVAGRKPQLNVRESAAIRDFARALQRGASPELAADLEHFLSMDWGSLAR
ncbi:MULTISPECIES: M12 family metallo-peptidase [unclassified Thiocapsa]|uniref:M12 family metallo-peptidase n=1 Tax=unclassified Thiocapsa TaxID=2641286 RepID=UPI0035B0DC50